MVDSLKKQEMWVVYCCNHYQRRSIELKSLTTFRQWMLELNHDIKPGMKNCYSYSKILKEKTSKTEYE
jgi:hypothetical protein